MSKRKARGRMGRGTKARGMTVDRSLVLVSGRSIGLCSQACSSQAMGNLIRPIPTKSNFKIIHKIMRLRAKVFRQTKDLQITQMMAEAIYQCAWKI